MFLIEAGYDETVSSLIEHMVSFTPTGGDAVIARAHDNHPPPLYEDDFPCITFVDSDGVFAIGPNEVSTIGSLTFEVRTLHPAIPQAMEWDGRKEAQVRTRQAMDAFLQARASGSNRFCGGYVLKPVRVQSGLFDQYGAPAGLDVERGVLLWVRLLSLRADLLS